MTTRPNPKNGKRGRGFILADECDDVGGGIGGEAADDDHSSYWRSIPDPPAEEAEAGNETKPAEGGGGGAKPTRARRYGGRRGRGSSFAFRDVTNDMKVRDEVSTGKRAAASSSDSEPARSDSFEEGTDGRGGSGRKRRKRRESPLVLLLPRSAGGTAGLPSSPSAGAATDGRYAVASSGDDVARARIETVAVSETSDERKRLVRLARDYVALPPNRRASSKEAREIRSLSGYPLSGNDALPFRESTTKEEFLLRVQPIVRGMERRKRIDEAEAREHTGCEARKDGKGGFQYFDADSGERVAAAEYRRRYAAMIDERRRRRRAGARADGSSGAASRTERRPGRPPFVGSAEDVGEPRAVDRESKSPGSDASGGADMDESVNMEDSSPDGAGEDAASPSSVGGGAPPEGGTPPDDGDPPVDVRGGRRGAVGGRPSGRRGATDGARRRGAPPDATTAPPSGDPRAIAARDRLRRAIDAALAQYSREILEIEGATESENGKDEGGNSSNSHGQ